MPKYRIVATMVIDCNTIADMQKKLGAAVVATIKKYVPYPPEGATKRRSLADLAKTGKMEYQTKTVAIKIMTTEK
jgi:hypothetical protein